MYNFTYHRPASVADAAALLAANADAKLLAGGQTYMPTLKQRLAQPTDLIDLGRIAELKGIKEEGGGAHHRCHDPARRCGRIRPSSSG